VTVSQIPDEPDDLHRGLLDELEGVGVLADSIADVMHYKSLPVEAVEVLVRHLSAPHSASVMTHIIRCLADRNAKPHRLFDTFIERFIAMPAVVGQHHRGLKEALAFAAAYHATREDVPTVLYALNQPGGSAYLGHFLSFLRRYRCREAGPLLERALSTVTTPESVAILAKAMVDVGWNEGLPALRGRLLALKGRAMKTVAESIARLESKPAAVCRGSDEM
jgi:hypothetical protein